MDVSWKRCCPFKTFAGIDPPTTMKLSTVKNSQQHYRLSIPSRIDFGVSDW